MGIKPTIAFAAVMAASTCAVADRAHADTRGVSAVAGAPPLNVVVIMTDDLEEDSMHVLLDHHLVPNIEQLYRSGIVFRRSFVSNSVCCPSRATFLTGQYSHNNHVLTSKGPDPEGGVDALDDTSTLATWLHDAGYRTGHIGKYLNGYGMDRFSEIPQFHPSYVPPGWDHWQGLIGASTYNTFDYRINDTVDGKTTIVRYGTNPEEYQTTVLASRADAFIRDADRRDDEQPFFLVVTPIAPHGEGKRDPNRPRSWYLNPDPIDLVEKKAQMDLIATLLPLGFDKPSFDYADPLAPAWLRNAGAEPLSEIERADMISYYRDRLGAMLAVDDLVGTVMTALHETGELEQTVVIFTSDNGFLFGEHRLFSKKVAFDEATRVPLVVRMPDDHHARFDNLVINADLAPTVADLAGVTPALPVDGRSLVPLLTGRDVTSWRKRLLLEHWGHFPTIPTYAGLRTPQYLYLEYQNDAADRELYDLVHDPYQTDNLSGAAEFQDVVSRLARKLDGMRSCSGDGCRLEESR